MTYKATLTDEYAAAWQKFMRDQGADIGVVMVKRPIAGKQKRKRIK